MTAPGCQAYGAMGHDSDQGAPEVSPLEPGEVGSGPILDVANETRTGPGLIRACGLTD